MIPHLCTLSVAYTLSVVGWFSALGQVPGTHFLHFSLSTAILFIFTYPSLLSFFSSFYLFSNSLFSSFSYQMLPLEHLSSLSLVYLTPSSPSLSPPTRLSINIPSEHMSHPIL